MTAKSDESHFDLLVIGFGKAGKSLAMERAEEGDSVALIKQDPAMYGGSCINIACVPTKALLSGTARGMVLREAQDTRDELVAAMNRSNKSLADEAGVTIINGRARFVGERRISVSGRRGGGGTGGTGGYRRRCRPDAHRRGSSRQHRFGAGVAGGTGA